MHELCTLMEGEQLNLCARAFETEVVDGKELFELSKDDFVLMLKETGGIADGLALICCQLLQSARA